jgi:hypothetical protein
MIPFSLPRMVFGLALFGILTGPGGLALAQDSTLGPSQPSSQDTKPDATMSAFGDRNKLCIEWTDTCRGCRRDAAGEIACSNIPIACQPKEIRCTLRRKETPK